MTIDEFPVPTAESQPWGITVGPDGNIWFTERRARKIGRISLAGDITEIAFPALRGAPGELGWPQAIVTGPDANIWFTANYFGAGDLGRVMPNGQVEYRELWPDGSHSRYDPRAITVGPDGNLWISVAGTRRNFVTARRTDYTFARSAALQTWHHGLDGIAIAGDSVWVTSQGFGLILQISLTGEVVEHRLPDPAARPAGITVGPDGALWFTESSANKIGRMTTDGVLTDEFPIPTPDSAPVRIVTGPDDNLWFTEENGSRIGRITVDGEITEFPTPTPHSGPRDITLGPDGNLWFVEATGNKVGRLSLGGVGRGDTCRRDVAAPVSSAPGAPTHPPACRPLVP
ncbi:MAG: Virginiamycin B lyase [Actinomycetota bacterium]|nr:Virginiamycin B lyase [Actinomycetota bacterium]